MTDTFLDDAGRPRIRATWLTPGKTTPQVAFLIDSGASRTCVTDEHAIDLTLAAVVEVGSPTGPKLKRYLFNGGAIEFEVTHASTGILEPMKYSGLVLALADDIIGMDLLRDCRLIIDFSVSPAQLRRAP